MSAPAWRPKPKRAYKPRSSAVTSAMMAQVRSKHNKAEVALRRALWSRGFRYRLHVRGVFGRPDMVFPKHRVALFVDGDYWHGRALKEGGEQQLRQVIRGSRFEWWRDKLATNIERDEKVTTALLEQGWQVIRLWESDVKNDLQKAVESVTRRLCSAECTSCTT